MRRKLKKISKINKGKRKIRKEYVATTTYVHA